MPLALDREAHAHGAEQKPSHALSSKSTEHDRRIVHGFVLQVVASIYEVDPTLLLAPGRGVANVALARQVAMYTAHVGCGMTLTDVGREFGRDRTTVAYACEVIEERREVESFDQMIELLESAAVMLRQHKGEEL